jgi:hypothetical protein
MTISNTPLSTIIKAMDVLVTCLLTKAIMRSEVINLATSNDAALATAFRAIEPRTSQVPGGASKRAPDEQSREQVKQHVEQKKAKAAAVPEQICDNFNANQGSCKGGAVTCKNGRRHVCSKCNELYARYSVPACK